MLYPIFIWYNDGLIRLNPLQIACLITEENYTKIFLADETVYQVRCTLSGALRKLHPDIFFRIHRSIVVSIFFINEITRDHLLVRGEPLPIGKLYYSDLLEKLNVIE